jgi:hypothetical protein
MFVLVWLPRIVGQTLVRTSCLYPEVYVSSNHPALFKRTGGRTCLECNGDPALRVEWRGLSAKTVSTKPSSAIMVR